MHIKIMLQLKIPHFEVFSCITSHIMYGLTKGTLEIAQSNAYDPFEF